MQRRDCHLINAAIDTPLRLLFSLFFTLPYAFDSLMPPAPLLHCRRSFSAAAAAHVFAAAIFHVTLMMLACRAMPARFI